MRARDPITLLSILLAALSIGCTATVDGIAGPEDGDGGANARGDFDALIVPIVRQCSGGACHTGTGTAPLKFLGPSTDSSTWYNEVVKYASVTGSFDPAGAALLSKIANGHQNIAYSQEQIDDITLWLTNESAVRGSAGDDIPGDPLALWSGCMTIESWNGSGMAEWAQKPAEGGTVCSSCHLAGMAEFDANPDPAEMFRRNRLRPFVDGFFVQAGTDILPAYDKLDQKGAGLNNHPTYLTGDEYYDRLEDFYQRTLSLQQADGCPESGFPAP